MVFDNADNLTPEELEQYFPSGLGGNILITSCNSGLKQLTLHKNSLEVREMEENDAISLLLKAACLDESEEDLQAEASKIVNELFCIPLAIDQAGAFIAFGDTDIRDYLEEYSQYREKLSYYPAFKGASRYNRTVYQTWEISYKEIQQRAKSDDSQRAEAASSAMLLLAMFSFFHFDGISEEIFSYAATQEHEKNGDIEQISALPLASSIIDHTLLQLDETGKWDNFLFKEGLQVLFSLSLIKAGSLKGMYAVHPLIHTWGRDRMSSEDKQKYSLIAYGMLAGCLLADFDKQSYQLRRTLVTHLRANIQHSIMSKKKVVERYFDDAHEKFGRLLGEQGFYSEAIEFQIQVLDQRSRTLGEEHPGTISAMSRLVGTYENLGKYADAEKLQIKVLDLQNKNLGEKHHDTIAAMSNLAAINRKLGEYTAAEKLQINALDLRKSIFGEEHPYTISDMANLAKIYCNLQRYTNAEKLQIKVVYSYSRILGEEHPHTIVAMSNLAATNKKLGKYTAAEKLQIKVLDARKKMFGEGHSHTILVMTNLANTYCSLGKYTNAEKLQIKVLDVQKKCLGEEHPDTITAMSNLAVINGNLGKYTVAEKLEIKVLDLTCRTFGDEHHDTILAMSNLAYTYQSLEKYAYAEKLKIKVLDLKNRLLGEEHPDTIDEMENLAIAFYYLQKYQDAAKLGVQVVNILKRIFGEEHPKTVKAVAILAEIKSQANRNTSGIELKKNSNLYLLWSLVSLSIFLFWATIFPKL